MTPKITHYTGAAGGWDALASSFHHVREQGIVGRGARTRLRARLMRDLTVPISTASMTAISAYGNCSISESTKAVRWGSGRSSRSWDGRRQGGTA